MTDDTQLLRDYVKDGSEPAFRELVERHIQLVNATATRMVGGDVHLARDVTQLVFTDLARKAVSIPDGVLLGGWLHRHTCFTASKTIRAERRRQARERTAMEMNSLYDNPGRDTQWSLLAPVLDDALNRLDAQDRDAIVLRYLQARDVRSIGIALGSSENAAQKRIGRALEKLRSILTRRGITLTAALLATTLDAGAKTTVPPGLAASISAHALAGASTGFTLTTLYNMITSKLGLSIISVVALTGVSTALIAQNQSSAPTLAPVAASPAPATQAAAPAPAQQPVIVKLTPAPQNSNTGSTPAPSQQPRRVNTGAQSGNGVIMSYNPPISTTTSSGTSISNNGDGTVTINTTDSGVTTTQVIPAPMPGQSTYGATPNGGGGGFGGGATSGGAGSYSRSSSMQSNGDGTVTITKTENGVTSTETVPAESVSSMPGSIGSGSGVVVYGGGSDSTTGSSSNSATITSIGGATQITTNTNGSVRTITLPPGAANGEITIIPADNTQDATQPPAPATP